MRKALAMLALAAAALPACALADPKPSLDAYVRNTLGIASYKSAEADLNGDGQPEQFVYATDPSWCGSGGCTLFVLQRHAGAYRTILRSAVTRLPIRLLPTTSHGWRDLALGIGGGGEKPDAVRLRFNGQKYPSNPTLAPRLLSMDAEGTTILAD